jgi:protoporphyrinogen/coproporphyrinogen III oxidase
VNDPGQPHVVVVGAGIAGLAAALSLRDAACRVTVLEGSPRLGGKLRVSEIAGVAVDEGAEALLARRPEGTGLAAAVGLADRLVWPGTTVARIWSRGRMSPLPRHQMMGVPADLAELAETGLISDGGMARARQDLGLPATARDGDVPVAGFVAARFGQEVVDRLVDPLLAGVYAGRSEELSFEATLPALAAESRKHASLAETAAAVLARGSTPPPRGQAPGPHGPEPSDGLRPGSSVTGPEPLAAPAGAGAPAPQPVFTTLAGGLGTLPGAVAAASGACVRTGAMVRGLARTAIGWRLTVGSRHDEEHLAADAVILAVPASPAARLLAGLPGASAAVTALREIRYASMAIVTLAYPAAAFPRPPEGSGYLVPAVDGRPVKAVTFSTAKWPHLQDAGPALIIVRCSVGRAGEEALLQSGDTELARLAAADLAAATGASGTPVATRVTRWGGGLPQYTVGHLDRVARIRSAVAAQPGLAVCGAAYDGIGIPACVATGQAAAAQIAAHLRDARQWERG